MIYNTTKSTLTVFVRFKDRIYNQYNVNQFKTIERDRLYGTSWSSLIKFTWCWLYSVDFN